MPLRFQLLQKQLLLKDDETRLELSNETLSKGNKTELNQDAVVALCNTQSADYGHLVQTLAESESEKLPQKQQLSESDNEAVPDCSSEQLNASNNTPTTSSLSTPQANNDSRSPGGADSGKRSTSSVKSICSDNSKNIKSQTKPDEQINKTVTKPRLIEPQSLGSSISSATKQALISSSYATSEPSNDTFLNSHTYQRASFYERGAAGKKASLEYTSQKRYRKRITYDEWLANKKKLEAKRALERRTELNRIAEENEQRRLLADKSYANWLAKKLYASLPSSQSATSIISPYKAQSSANRRSTERKGFPHPRNARGGESYRSNYSKQNMEKNVVLKHKGINNHHSKSSADKIRPQRNSSLEAAKINRGRGIGGRHDRQQSANTEPQNRGTNMNWKQFFTKGPGKSLPLSIGPSPHPGATLHLYLGPNAFHNASSLCQAKVHNRNMSSQNGRRTVVPPRQRRQPSSETKSPVSTMPLSAAQRGLRKRLNDMDGVTMMKQFKKKLT